MDLGRARAAARIRWVRTLVLLACVFCTGCKIGEVLKGLVIALAATLLMGSLFGTLGKGGAAAAAKNVAVSQGTGAIVAKVGASKGSGGDGESNPALEGTSPSGKKTEETIGGKTADQLRGEGRQEVADGLANTPMIVEGQLPDPPLPRPVNPVKASTGAKPAVKVGTSQ